MSGAGRDHQKARAMTDTARPDSQPDERDTPYRYTAALAAADRGRAGRTGGRPKGTFEAPNPAGPLAEPDKVAARPKRYVLDMFPYPSGIGLHVGHPLGYIATDVHGRFKRMTGHNVLHALGYDAFGLPAEQYAVQTGQHPRVTTEANIATMRAQLRRLGLAHDRRRSVVDHRPRVLPLDPVDLPADLQQLVRRGGRPGPADRRAGAVAGLRRPTRAGGRPRRPVRRRVGGPGRAGPPRASSTRTGWPTCRTRRSTGARAWARCWPTRRSPPTGAATAATSRSSSATCASG